MQYKIGSCTLNQIAALMVCPVVAKHEHRLQIIIHGGAVHFSKESIKDREKTTFGQLVNLDEKLNVSIIPNCYIKSLSQEHGIIQCDEASFQQFTIGDLMVIIPIHSCLTANLMKEKVLFLD